MKTSYEVAVMPGDGIGPEVTEAAVAVLDSAARNHGVQLVRTTYEAGAEYYRRTGEAISEAVLVAAGEADAVLFGAMGLPDVRRPDGTETGPQVELRERYGLFASLRPTKLFAGVPTRLKADKIDILVIRETTEGLFAGRNDYREPSDESVSDRMTITRATCEKLFDLAFAQARSRRHHQGTPGRVTLLDKANALPSQAFMRKIFDEVALRHPDIENDRRYIDAGAMMFVTAPESYDVVVSENIFGDITSEIGAGIVGGLGVAPSADIGLRHGVFQPSHGTAPELAGLGVANPVAAILSAAMLLDWLAERHGDERCNGAAGAIRSAVEHVLACGPKTRDIGGDAKTSEVTEALLKRLNRVAMR
jgi:3-isopropylmalate dehydrogenase